MRAFLTFVLALGFFQAGLCALLSHKVEDTSFVLAKSLTVTLSEAAYVTVEYAPESGSVGPYYTAWQYISSSTGTGSVEGSVELFRLRSQTTYTVTIYTKTSEDGTPTEESTTSFTTSSTGISYFDDGAYATITGTPTYEILVIDAGLSSTSLNGSEAPPPPMDDHGGMDDDSYTFGGLIGLDTEGYVVWYYSYPSGLQPWDQLQDGSYNMIGQAGSGLIQFDAYGNLVEEYTPSTCTSYSNMQDISHDARIQADDDSYPVLSISSHVVTYDRDDLLSDRLVSWDRDTNTVSIVYDLYDYFSPGTYAGELSTGSENAMCGSKSETAEDWTHMNSVANGPYENYILSVRSWSAVVSMFEDGSGADWVLSAEVPSNFTFVDGVGSKLGAEFYNQHSVIQLDNGNIIMMDNGNVRSGCSNSGSGCYSRGAEYELDYTEMTATLVWEFSPGLYTSKGGNALVMSANDHRIIAFPAVDDSTADDDFYAYEADSDGNQIAQIHLPACSMSWYAGAYRASPLSSLYGESTTSTISS